MSALAINSAWRYLLLFKNQGVAAGATLAHVHSQLVALSIVPPAARQEIVGARKFFQEHRTCAHCAMIKRESSTGERLIAIDADYIVFCPYAARIPFETWIVPQRHRSIFMTDDNDPESLARALRTTLRRIDRCLKHIPFNFVIRSSPPELGETPYYHWRLEILPRLAQIGGFEWGTASYINVATPEDAADRLRKIRL
jgi:UDPglucose--hexose-1-phosphate uridylyltransferase